MLGPRQKAHSMAEPLGPARPIFSPASRGIMKETLPEVLRRQPPIPFQKGTPPSVHRLRPPTFAPSCSAKTRRRAAPRPSLPSRRQLMGRTIKRAKKAKSKNKTKVRGYLYQIAFDAFCFSLLQVLIFACALILLFSWFQER